MTGTGMNAMGSLEGIALELVGQLTEIRSRRHWQRWRESHANVLAALYRLLPDCSARRRLTFLGRAKKARFGAKREPVLRLEPAYAGWQGTMPRSTRRTSVAREASRGQ